MLDDKLFMPMKRMGMITLFNGIDFLQSRHYIKIFCQMYIEKMCAKYLLTWMKDLKDVANRPLPVPRSETFIEQFLNAVGDD